jgi:hypothetical protein
MSRPVACPWLVGALTRSETSVDDLKPRHARGFLYRPSSGRARSASRSSQAARLAMGESCGGVSRPPMPWLEGERGAAEATLPAAPCSGARGIFCQIVT